MIETTKEVLKLIEDFRNFSEYSNNDIDAVLTRPMELDWIPRHYSCYAMYFYDTLKRYHGVLGKYSSFVGRYRERFFFGSYDGEFYWTKKLGRLYNKIATDFIRFIGGGYAKYGPVGIECAKVKKWFGTWLRSKECEDLVGEKMFVPLSVSTAHFQTEFGNNVVKYVARYIQVLNELQINSKCYFNFMKEDKGWWSVEGLKEVLFPMSFNVESDRNCFYECPPDILIPWFDGEKFKEHNEPFYTLPIFSPIRIFSLEDMEDVRDIEEEVAKHIGELNKFVVVGFKGVETTVAFYVNTAVCDRVFFFSYKRGQDCPQLKRLLFDAAMNAGISWKIHEYLCRNCSENYGLSENVCWVKKASELSTSKSDKAQLQLTDAERLAIARAKFKFTATVKARRNKQ